MEDLVIYTTTQTHSLGAKAALVLGLQVKSIEVTPEDNYALRGDALLKALEDDAKLGRKPFILSKSLFIFSSSKRPVSICSSCYGWNDLLRRCR